jgi:prophage antirepressor-like protein
MNNITPFQFNSCQIRTTQVEGEPMFVAKDVATVLGCTNPLKAIRDQCEDCEQINATQWKFGFHCDDCKCEILSKISAEDEMINSFNDWQD